MKVCVYKHVAADSIDNYFRYVYVCIPQNNLLQCAMRV